MEGITISNQALRINEDGFIEEGKMDIVGETIFKTEWENGEVEYDDYTRQNRIEFQNGENMEEQP